MKVIDEIVLNDIKSKAKLVFENEKLARKEFLAHQEKISDEVIKTNNKKLTDAKQRVNDLTLLIQSTYEDKVLNKIPEDICINLLNNYQKEKDKLQQEILKISNILEQSKQKEKNVDEFIRLVKKHIESPTLTREITMELIEFITIDKFNKDKTQPRQIHIYYKLLDNKSPKEIKKCL